MIKSYFKKSFLYNKTFSKLVFVLFLSSFSVAAISTIWSLYLKSFLGSDSAVGFLSSFFALVVLISCIGIVPLIERHDKAKLFLISLAILTISCLVFYFNTNFVIFLVIATLFVFARTLRGSSFGLIVKDSSKRNQLSKNEGFVFTWLNFAWVLGPLFGGYLLAVHGFNFVFLISGIFSFLSLILFKISKIKDVHIKKRIDKHSLKNVFDFFKDKQRTLSYFLTGGISAWWVLIFIFMPLYIVENGLSELWVGYFVFAVGIPLVLFEYYFSDIAGKKGFKLFFKIGYFIPAFLVLVCFFIPNVYFVLVLLILASIGISMLEPTTESYFFDITKGKQDLRFYSIYRTSSVVNELIVTFISGFVLLFFSLEYLFLFFAFVMFLYFLFSFRTKNILEYKRK